MFTLTQIQKALSAVGLVLAAVAPFFPEYSTYLILGATTLGAVGAALSQTTSNKWLTVVGVVVALTGVLAPAEVIPPEMARILGALGAAAAALGRSLFGWEPPAKR